MSANHEGGRLGCNHAGGICSHDGREPLSARHMNVKMPHGTEGLSSTEADAVLAAEAGWTTLQFYTSGISIRDWKLVGRHLKTVIIGTPQDVGRYMHAVKTHRITNKETP